MYQPQQLIIENIGSIKEMTYTFKTAEAQIVQGQNLDDNGQRNNGVGKSSFIDAIGFAITGLSLRNITTEELIRDGENQAFIQLSLKNKAGRELVIKRTLFRKKPQIVEIEINGQEVHGQYPDVNARNEKILDEIGINKDDLFQFFLITKDRYKPYFKLSDTDKKAITSRFSKADVIDDVFPLIDKDIATQQTIVNQLTLEINSKTTQIQLYRDEIVNLENNSGSDYKDHLKEQYQGKLTVQEANIVNLKEQIVKSDTEIANVERLVAEENAKLTPDAEIEQLNAEIQELQKKNVEAANQYSIELNTINKDLEVLESDQTEIRNEITNHQKAIYDLENQRAKEETFLKSAIDCPACQHTFCLSTDRTIVEIQKSIDSINAAIALKQEEQKELVGVLEEYKTAIAALDDKKKKIRIQIEASLKVVEEQIKTIRVNINELERSNSEIRKRVLYLEQRITSEKIGQKNALHQITASENIIESIKQQILDVDKIDNQGAIDRYNTLITSTEEELKESNKLLGEATVKLQDLNSWALKFKGFKSYLANQSLKNIEDLANYYLGKMNTNLSVQIESHQQKGKVVKEKITETILRNGTPIGSYGRFSGGERGRIDVGSILANQTLINNNASPKGLDLILIDEVLESLDAVGIESVIKAMENVDKTLILISQNEINTLPSQTITLVKENNQTKIK